MLSKSHIMRFAPVTRNITKLLDIKSMKMLDTYSVFNPSPLTLKQFVDFGKSASETDSYHFVKREVPVRLANIMKEINLLPSNLLQMPSVVELQEWYATSFMELCTFEGTTGERQELDEFVKVLEKIRQRHQNAVEKMAQGVLELKESHAVDSQTENSIQYFLDRFYMSRMSTRMLCNQHTVLFGPEEFRDPRPSRVGCIDTACSIKAVVKHAFDHASQLCEEHYYYSPDIDLKVHNATEPDKDIQICYVPQNLHHILFELFKNSMRAVVESRRGTKSGFTDLPDIGVLISRGREDVTIKISDQGGGIPRQVQDNLFQYLYSTAPRPPASASAAGASGSDQQIQPPAQPPVAAAATTKTAFAGYGYGLPLSRLYARYLHGDLVLSSCEGYGTDACIYLKTDTSESVELLPVFNKTSTKQYKSAVPTADWSDPSSTMNRHYHPTYQSKALTNA